MKRVLRAIVGSALCLTLMSAAVVAAPARASQPRTPASEPAYRVADFAVDLLAAMGMRGQTHESALAALRTRGIVVANPNKPVTESDVVSLLSQAGVTVTTKSPNKIVGSSQANEIIRAFGPQLAAPSSGLVNNCVGCDSGTGSNPNDDFNNGGGRGGKFKRKKKNSQTGSD